MDVKAYFRFLRLLDCYAERGNHRRNKKKIMKYLNFQKLLLVFGLLFAIINESNAQFLRTSYFMEGSHYRQQLNPALTPGRGYLNLPVRFLEMPSVTSWHSRLPRLLSCSEVLPMQESFFLRLHASR